MCFNAVKIQKVSDSNPFVQAGDIRSHQLIFALFIDLKALYCAIYLNVWKIYFLSNKFFVVFSGFHFNKL